jgi:uncharacterized protein
MEGIGASCRAQAAKRGTRRLSAQGSHRLRTGARRLYFAGSIKWLTTPFDRHDLAELARGVTAVPGYVPGEVDLAIVSLSGLAPDLDLSLVRLAWGPADVLAAWQG